METYLNTQRDHVFSSVAILIYVFDAESKEFERDLITYASVVRALHENSPSAAVFCLIHKMDLVPESFHDKIYEQRKKAVISRTEFFDITCFPTSIWTHTLYKAWGDIVYTLIPNTNQIKYMLEQVGEGIEAEEIILFERTTFLPVCTVCSDVGELNPDKSRHEKISNIVKVFKQSIS
jgi:Ras-related GTP-binding protein A/B